jgi:hypothetical protein
VRRWGCQHRCLEAGRVEQHGHQLRLICEKLGKPAEADLDFVSTESARKFIMDLAPTAPVPLASLFPKASEAALVMPGRTANT